MLEQLRAALGQEAGGDRPAIHIKIKIAAAGQGGLDPQSRQRLHRARDRKLPTADVINHHQSLAGPAGRHDTDAPRTIGIWKFSKNIEASKEWIKYLLGKKEVYDEYLMSGGGFNQPIYTNMQDHAVFKTDPKLAVLKGEGVNYHTYGWPAPASDKVQLITNSFIVPNMLAKAVTGTSTKDAIAWAENEMKKIIAA